MNTTEIKQGSIYKSRAGVYAKINGSSGTTVNAFTRNGSPGRYSTQSKDFTVGEFTKNFKLVEAVKASKTKKNAADLQD